MEPIEIDVSVEPIEIESADVPTIEIDVDTQLAEAEIDNIRIVRAGEIYDGSYDVVPLAFTETLLETSGKHMLYDVTVQEIPYFETSNESGGYTVIIG